MGVYNDPASDIIETTPADGVSIGEARGFRIGGSAGDVTIKTIHGDLRTIKNLVEGESIAVRFTELAATGTTATGIEVMY